MGSCIGCGGKCGDTSLRCKQCANLYKNKSIEFRIKVSNALLGRVFSEQWKLNFKKARARINLFGENNPNWKGGTSFQPYPKSWNKALKAKVRKRDKSICQVCKRHEEEFKKKLSIHHINYNKLDDSSANLICLCAPCHLKTNGNRAYWKKYFQFNKEDLQNVHV